MKALWSVNGEHRVPRLLEILYKRVKPSLNLDVYLLFNQVPEVDMITDLETWATDFNEDGIKYASHISCSCTRAYQMVHGTTIFPSDHEFTQSLMNVIQVLSS